jgi:hypothetical protein
VSTDVAVLGGREVKLASGWTNQTLVAILGGAHVDATPLPGPGAKLKLVTILGGAEVIVPAGARVSQGGFAFLGGRHVDVDSRDDGPEIGVTAFSFFGGVSITDRPSK